jgi:hypothetical protein
VPAPGELDDITATVIAYAKKHSVAKNPQVTGVRVSTKGPYARATAKARGADPATVVLKTKGSGWKVLQLGTDISCDVAPARVMKDLRLDRSCAKN